MADLYRQDSSPDPSYNEHKSSELFYPQQLRLTEKFSELVYQDNHLYQPQSWLQRFFPTQYEKMLQQQQAKDISQQYEDRREILTQISQLFSDDLALRAKEHLKRIGIQLGEESRRTAAQSVVSLQRIIFSLRKSSDELIWAYVFYIDKKFLELAQIKDDKIRAHLEQHLRREAETFIESIEQPYQKFVRQTMIFFENYS